MDTIIDSIQDVNYNGRFYSKKEIIKLAIYHCLFLFVFLFYLLLELLCIYLYVKDGNIVVFRVVVTGLLLLFLLFIILFVSLRHSLKESFLGTIIALVLVHIPFCRFACSVSSLTQAKKILSLAYLDKFEVPFIPYFTCLLKENTFKTPRFIWSFTKKYVIFILLFLIPTTGYHTTEYILEKKDNLKHANMVASSDETYSYEKFNKGNPPKHYNDSSYFNKEKLIQLSVLVGIILLKDALMPQSQQTPSGPGSVPIKSLPYVRFGKASGVFSGGETNGFDSGTSRFGSSSGAFLGSETNGFVRGTSGFDSGISGFGSSSGAFSGSGNTNISTFGGTSTTILRDSTGMSAGSLWNTGNTIQIYDSTGRPAGSSWNTGNTTQFYDSTGRPAGSSWNTGNIMQFYDSTGRPAGSMQPAH